MTLTTIPEPLLTVDYLSLIGAADRRSLRASAETDLMDVYGLRRACQWAGNSAATAMKNYAQVRSTDFDDAGAAGTGKWAIPNTTPNAPPNLSDDAKCAAVPAGSVSQDAAKNAGNPAFIENVPTGTLVPVGDEGLEPPTSSV